jgi:hypothetical protein
MPNRRGAWMARRIEIEVDVVRGDAGLVQGQGIEMPNMILCAKSEDELWEDAGPVLRGILEIEGDTVIALNIDRRGRRLQVDLA